MARYQIGDEDLDRRIAQLIADASDNPNQDLIAEMMTTAIKLLRDRPTRGDLKLINTALKEMRYSDLVFARHDEPKVTIYGSARTRPDDPNYEVAKKFGALMAGRGWGVITGAGPGIMEAGNKGAGRDDSYGVNIRLPFEASANDFVRAENTVNFKYFFTRKLGFVKESSGFAVFPGGFGTMDEMFELLTLVQTGKSDLHPIVLLEAKGTGYWEPVIDFCEDVLVAQGMISREDLGLFGLFHDPAAAAEEILGFYANYRSQRYVDGVLVLRLERAPDDDQLAELNADFADIVVEGTIERIEATPAEVEDNDSLDLERISFLFDRRQFGRLRSLVNRINQYVATPERVTLPTHMTEEQAERPW
ncbi:MAG: TIGR00730 family Rossman fold protein [Acidimicrobiia bacterium]|nr:TIGR00730 family Rossman fold protein [Acidimicrobiia bacterium]